MKKDEARMPIKEDRQIVGQAENSRALPNVGGGHLKGYWDV